MKSEDNYIMEVLDLTENSTQNMTRVDELNAKASEVRKDNNCLALELSKEAISAAVSSDYLTGLAYANLNAGISCRIASEFDTAIDHLTEALKIFKLIKHKKGETRTLNAIANVYLNLSNFEKAIEYYDECIYILQSIGDLHFEASVLSNRGLAYQQFGDLRSSLNNFLESLSLYKSTNNEIHHSLFNNLGIVYLETGKYNWSLLYFTEALKSIKDKDQINDEGLVIANLGRTYLYMEDFSNAITYLSEAMIIMKNYGNRQAETQVYANLGKAYRRMRSFPESVKFYSRALKYYREISDRSSVAHTLSEMGELYFELNNYKTCKELLSEGLEISRSIKDTVNEVRIQTGLARLYVKFRDTEKANNYLENAMELARSRNAFKELSLICELYSEMYSLKGDFSESKRFVDQQHDYLKKLNNITEENKEQAIMLGNLHGELITKDKILDKQEYPTMHEKPVLKIA